MVTSRKGNGVRLGIELCNSLACTSVKFSIALSTSLVVLQGSIFLRFLYPLYNHSGFVYFPVCLGKVVFRRRKCGHVVFIDDYDRAIVGGAIV